MPVAVTGYAHVRLTVTDIGASCRDHEAVLGLPVAYEVPEDADDATREAPGYQLTG